MMFPPTMLAAALASALAAPSPALRIPQGAVAQSTTREPQTSQTIDVSKGTRLRLENYAGEVIVRTWNRDAVRIIARHSTKVGVEVKPAAAVLTIRSSSAGRGSVDYEITAPQWMALSISGTYNFITVEGAQSEVSAQTTKGDIVIKGGTGTILAKSIQGQVIVEGVRGRVTASSVNESIRITDAAGDITAETTNGDITLTQMKSASAEVTTVNGDIRFEGTPAPSGRYRFTTHNGNIIATVPETANASFIVRTYQGDFGSTLKLAGPPRAEARQGRRQTYTLGNGSAEMEMETFGGSIRVRAPGATTKDKTPQGKDPKDKGTTPAPHQ